MKNEINNSTLALKIKQIVLSLSVKIKLFGDKSRKHMHADCIEKGEIFFFFRAILGIAACIFLQRG